MLTARQEAFCRGLAKGLSGRESYLKAGYGAKPRVADTTASRLLAKANIRRRVAQLQQQAAQKAVVTVETIAAELDAAYRLAFESGQPAACVAAAMGKAKLFGLVVDKQELRAEIVRRPVADPYAPAEMSMEEWRESYGQPKTIEGRINGSRPG